MFVLLCFMANRRTHGDFENCRSWRLATSVASERGETTEDWACVGVSAEARPLGHCLWRADIEYFRPWPA